MNRPITYGLVGDGRVARHMATYLDLLGKPHVAWSRRTAAPGRSPMAALAEAKVILVLIKDQALEPFLLEHPALADRALVHFSGSLVTPLAQGVHPLMTFGPEPYDLATYASIPFVVERGPRSFEELFPELPNPHHELHADLKPLYHALCVLSGNFTTLLWQKFFTELETRLHLPPEVAMPYLNQVTKNLVAHPSQALTGPLARKDHATIAANLAALEGDAFEGVYRAFVRALAPEVALS